MHNYVSFFLLSSRKENFLSLLKDKVFVCCCISSLESKKIAKFMRVRYRSSTDRKKNYHQKTVFYFSVCIMDFRLRPEPAAMRKTFKKNFFFQLNEKHLNISLRYLCTFIVALDKRKQNYTKQAFNIKRMKQSRRKNKSK